MGAVIMAAVAAAERRLIRTLQAGGATTPATAITLSTLSSVQRRRLENLARQGVIQQVPGERWYLDPAAWAAFREGRRRRIGYVLLLAVGVALVSAWFMLRNRP